MKKLSHSQQAILEYIKDEIERKGYPPSVREICEATGLKSTSTVHGHLKRLELKGFIRRDLTKPRAIELLQNRPGRNTVSLPLVGKVAAGEPITAVENVEENIQIPQQFIGGGEHFMLIVQGDSMINAGIFSGDYVVVKKQDTCQNGEIAVALIDDEATVKTFYKERGRIRLQPQNDSMQPIIVDDCEILGKVVCLIRTLL